MLCISDTERNPNKKEDVLYKHREKLACMHGGFKCQAAHKQEEYWGDKNADPSPKDVP
jgi:hypothetical protein